MNRFLVLNMKDTKLKGETLIKRGGDLKKKRRPGALLMFSNNNICPSLQTARTPSIPASLLAVVSIATGLSSPLLRSVSANKSPRCAEEQTRSYCLFQHTLGDAREVTGRPRPRHRRAAQRIERRLRSSLPTHNLPKNSCPCAVDRQRISFRSL